MEAKTRYKKPKAVKILESMAQAAIKEAYPGFPYPPRQKYRDDSSNALTSCVIDFIRLKGFQAERINSTGRKVKIKGLPKWIKGNGQKGTADISATIKGKSVKIEIKCAATGDRYQSRHQKEYQRQIEQAGGIYIIVRDFTQFYQWFENFVYGS